MREDSHLPPFLWVFHEHWRVIEKARPWADRSKSSLFQPSLCPGVSPEHFRRKQVKKQVFLLHQLEAIANRVHQKDYF